MFLLAHLALFTAAFRLRGALGVSGPEVPRDSQTFVSRPDIIAPLLDVKTHDAEHVSPGFWFLPVYNDKQYPKYSIAHQLRDVGPYIYDTYGNLVWSGASLFRRRATYDFKPSMFNGSQHLSLILFPATREALKQPPIYGAEGENTSFPDGANLFLDSSYSVRARVPMDVENAEHIFNMHEFNVLDGGKRALRVTGHIEYWEYADDGSGSIREGGFVMSDIFQEFDTITGEVIFEWNALSHVLPSASYKPKPDGWGGRSQPAVIWDYFHMNSVDKDNAGDYIMSARFTRTIYKISHLTGSIIWSLGGKDSSFTLLPERSFNFSYQHDARFRGESNNTNITLISFLNNAAADGVSTAKHSSAFLVALNKTDMTATLVGHWDRPDGKLSLAKGNVQILGDPSKNNPAEPNNSNGGGGNIFVGWADNSYLSEFTASGVCVQEARFLSYRYTTYRIYKYPFVATPKIEEMAIKASSRGEMNGGKPLVTTAVYISWNGATEVDEWKIYNARNGSSDGDEGTWNFVGSVKKTGFESIFISDGYLAFVRAQALDSKGRGLGNSSTYLTTPPVWDCGDENCGELLTDSFMIGDGNLSSDPVGQPKKASPSWTTVAFGNYLITISWPTLMFGSVFFFLLSSCLLSMAALGVCYIIRERWATVGSNFQSR